MSDESAKCENSSKPSLYINAENYIDLLNKYQSLKEAHRSQSWLRTRYSSTRLYLFPGIRAILFSDFNHKK
jgi:hypothetical protein